MTSPDEPTIADPPAKRHGDARADAVEASPADAAGEPQEGEEDDPED